MKEKGLVAAIIVAAGEGKRFGGPKQFASLAGRRVFEWAIDALDTHPEVDEIIVVLPDAQQSAFLGGKWSKIKAVVRGGKERQDSVANGLAAVRAEAEIVLVHDGVRPMISHDLISRVIKRAREEGAAIPVLPVEETVKIVEGEEVRQTIDRKSLRRVQTPQGFRKDLLETALKRAQRDGFYGPDEASLVERLGHKVITVPGERKNLKITTTEDIKIMEVWLHESGYRL
ncbi:MAG: 2-C-methyl-D-erythritol 4-phosphate cytidylyltransferase [Candidatus Aminicenantales bacterium]